MISICMVRYRTVYVIGSLQPRRGLRQSHFVNGAAMRRLRTRHVQEEVNSRVCAKTATFEGARKDRDAPS